MPNAARVLLRLCALPILVACFASAGVACSSGTAPGSTGDGGASQSPSGALPGSQGGTASGDPAAAQAAPGATATRFELARSFCGAAFGSCAGDAGVQVVDFGTATLETHRCVELKDGGTEAIPAPPPGTTARFGNDRGDAITKRALTTAQMATLRAKLGDVRYASAKLTELDGAITVLTVEAPSGKLVLLPVARCGGPDYEQIVGGLPELQAALDSL
jgi:hypothetical protein